MAGFRKSKALTNGVGAELYSVPEGKTASVSVAVTGAGEVSLAIQKAAITEHNTVTDKFPSMGAPNIVMPASADGRVDKSRPMYSAQGQVDFEGSFSSTQGLTWTVSQIKYSEAGAENELFAPDDGRVLIDMPMPDYRMADVTKAVVVTVNGGNAEYRRLGKSLADVRNVHLLQVYRSASNWDRGATGFAGHAVSVNASGHVTVNGSNYTSATSFQQRGIGVMLAGSMQFFYTDADDGMVFASKWTTTAPPTFFFIRHDQVGNYSSWNWCQLTQVANGTKVLWMRHTGSLFIIGTSDNRVFSCAGIAGNGGAPSINAADWKEVSLPAGLDATFPPIITAKDVVNFRAASGLPFVGNGDLSEIRRAQNGIPAELPASVLSQISNPLFAMPTGKGPQDILIINASRAYSVNRNWLQLEPGAPFLRGVKKDFERTGLVLEGGDRLFVLNEGAGAVAHVYGYED